MTTNDRTARPAEPGEEARTAPDAHPGHGDHGDHADHGHGDAGHGDAGQGHAGADPDHGDADDAKNDHAENDADDSHGHGQHGGLKAVLAALGANVAIAISKFVAFSVTGAASMLAEGVHSLADSTNQVLLLVGVRRARRGADEDHPFGYGRERFFWAFVVALVLFSLGSLFALYQGVLKLRDPEPIVSPVWDFGVLGFAVVAESLSLRTAVVEIRRVKGDATFRQFVRRAKVPELPVILLEDLGALCGLLLALTAVGLTELTGDPIWDAYGSLGIGLLLGVIAVVLATEMKSLLIGESASRKQREAIEAAVMSEPSVLRLIHMRTEHLGPEELLIGAKVEFIHDLTLPEVAAAVDRVESNVRANVPEARVMYVEPDVSKDHRDAPLVVEHVPGTDVPDEVRERMAADAAAARARARTIPADDPPPGQRHRSDRRRRWPPVDEDDAAG
ncbi:MAG: cation diffusion facilitator family transporter [Actinobacteria bacterium]|nr:cation diffusion facilitator family transporter [Actinomycetota bacterium]